MSFFVEVGVLEKVLGKIVNNLHFQGYYTYMNKLQIIYKIGPYETISQDIKKK